MGEETPSDQPSVSVDDLIDHVLLEYTTAVEEQRKRRHQKILFNLAKVSTSALNRDDETSHLHQHQVSSVMAINDVDLIDIPAVVFPAMKKLPDGVQWVRARTSVRLPGCFSDNYYVPYLGESERHQESSFKLAKILCDDDSDVEDNSDVEGMEVDGASSSDEEGDGHEGEGDSVLLVKMERKRSRKRKNRLHTSPIIEKLSTTGKLSAYKWDRAAKLIAFQRFSAIFLPPNCDVLSSNCAIAVQRAFHLSDEGVAHAYMAIVTKRIQLWETKAKEDEQLGLVKAGVISHISGKGLSSASDVLKGDSIPFFFCRQCYVYDCPLHENSESGPASAIPDRSRKDSASKQISEQIESVCTSRQTGCCWHIDPRNDECSAWWADMLECSMQLADDLKALLQVLLPIFGDDFCRVSSSVQAILRGSYDKSVFLCSRVGYVSTVFFNNLLQKPFCSRSKKSMKFRSAKPVAELESMNGGIRPDFTPCSHVGLCTVENCSCVANGVFCEKYCGCNTSRPNQQKSTRRCNWAFPGCSCRSACSSNLCPCFSWKRECDPDLCRFCHECKDFEGDGMPFACRNVGLRLKKSCRVFAGRSEIHGWGLFSATDIPQNELVGEYVGEVLGDQVAERRGRVYDEVQTSFLFEITKGLSLDSTRIGNKLRYCNHSSDPNLEPRLMRVGGDVRIGIYAKRDIGKLEELFFNYGSKFKNRWEMKDSKDGKAEFRSIGQKRKTELKLEIENGNGGTLAFPHTSNVRNKRKLKLMKTHFGPLHKSGQGNRNIPARSTRFRNYQRGFLPTSSVSTLAESSELADENKVGSRRSSIRLKQESLPNHRGVGNEASPDDDNSSSDFESPNLFSSDCAYGTSNKYYGGDPFDNDGLHKQELHDSVLPRRRNHAKRLSVAASTQSLGQGCKKREAITKKGNKLSPLRASIGSEEPNNAIAPAQKLCKGNLKRRVSFGHSDCIQTRAQSASLAGPSDSSEHPRISIGIAETGSTSGHNTTVRPEGGCFTEHLRSGSSTTKVRPAIIKIKTPPFERRIRSWHHQNRNDFAMGDESEGSELLNQSDKQNLASNSSVNGDARVNGAVDVNDVVAQMPSPAEGITLRPRSLRPSKRPLANESEPRVPDSRIKESAAKRVKYDKRRAVGARTENVLETDGSLRPNTSEAPETRTSHQAGTSKDKVKDGRANALNMATGFKSRSPSVLKPTNLDTAKPRFNKGSTKNIGDRLKSKRPSGNTNGTLSKVAHASSRGFASGHAFGQPKPGNLKNRTKTDSRQMGSGTQETDANTSTVINLVSDEEDESS